MKSDVLVTDKEKIHKPYKGLSPYSKADTDKFFGRTKDIQRIINSLLAWHLTVLYGDSGVGKSSVLGAGVIPALEEEANQNMEDYAVPKLAVVMFSPPKGNWQEDPLKSLTAQIEEQITKQMGNIFFPIQPPKPKLSFVEMLEAWTKVLGGEDFDGWLFIILDQFEEYFQYHPKEESEGGFITEFSKALYQPNLHVNFLISLREDFYVNLNRLRGHIPSILDNCLHIEHLDKDEAEEAIKKPIERYYNQQAAPEQPVIIEQKLVDELLKAISYVKVKKTSENAQDGVAISEELISPPYLQLLMTRLWHEMEKNESHCLSLQTLTSLGDKKARNEKDKIKTAIENIIKQYIIKQMEALSDREKEIAAKSFQYLVKRSKNKGIDSLQPNSIDNLAKSVQCKKEELQDLLEKLAQSNPPVIRRISSLDPPNVVRYEFFHDFLASAFFIWGGEYILKKQSKTRRILLFSSLGFLLFLSGYGLCKTIYDNRLNTLAQQTSQAEIEFNNGNQLSALKGIVKAGNQLEQDMLISNRWISQILFSSSQRQTLDKQFNWTFQIILNEIQQVNQFDPPHKSPSNIFFLSPDGKTLAILLLDGTVQLWDRQNNQELVNLKASGSVSSVSFSPDGKTLTIASTKNSSVFVERPIENINLKDMRNQGCKKLQPYLDSYPDQKKELGCD